MNLQDIVNNPLAMRLSMFVSQHTPAQMGRRLALLMACLVSKLEPKIYRIVQANLSQVLELEPDASLVRQTARHVFYFAIRGYYDLYRALGLPHKQVSDLIEVSDPTRALLDSVLHNGRGTVMAIPHLGNFDLAGQAMAGYVPELQVLTLPNPPPGFQWTNELRRRSGMAITPLSPAALRQAIQLLRRGGTVTVGGDRPVSELDKEVAFFGRLTRVPSGHVRLALRTDADVIVAYCVLSPETDKYVFHVEPPIEMIRTGDQKEDVHLNMRRVLDTLESAILCWPEQWQMFVPVWPELVEA